MKLEWLRYFTEAVKYRSISVAAEKNYISQPSFSSGISKLEKELGAKLLLRTNQGVSPTEIGQMVYEKAGIIFGTFDEMKQEANSANTLGTVKILSIPLFYDYFIPNIVLKAREMNQPYLIEANTDETAGIISSVSSGFSDFGILYYDEDMLNRSVTYTPLFKETFVVFVGKESPYWDADSIALDDVLKEPYAAYRDEFNNNDNNVWTKMLGAGVRPNISFRTDDLGMLKQVVAKSDYVAFYPKYMSMNDPFLCNGVIRTKPLKGIHADLEVGYIYNNFNKLNSFCMRFIDIMKSTVEEHLDTSCIH